MNLYLISQTQNIGYDTHDSAVVCAESEEDAKTINPSGGADWGSRCSSWCKSPDQVAAQYLGVAETDIARGVVLASFNAG